MNKNKKAKDALIFEVERKILKLTQIIKPHGHIYRHVIFPKIRTVNYQLYGGKDFEIYFF